MSSGATNGSVQSDISSLGSNISIIESEGSIAKVKNVATSTVFPSGSSDSLDVQNSGSTLYSLTSGSSDSISLKRASDTSLTFQSDSVTEIYVSKATSLDSESNDSVITLKSSEVVESLPSTSSDISLSKTSTSTTSSKGTEFALSLYWRKIYQTVTGYSQTVNCTVVSEIFNLIKNDFIKGLLYFEPYSKEDYDKWKKNTDLLPTMNEFMKELSEFLNLKTSTAFQIVSNYIMFEYYGKLKEFRQIIKGGTTIRLKETIWYFYTSERMFLLKVLKHIFEFANDKNYKFSGEYRIFLETINVQELQNNLIDQFEIYINEIGVQYSSYMNHFFEKWVGRNYREQIETLLILILSTDYSEFTSDQIKRILRLFLNNNFGTQPFIYKSVQLSDKQDIHDLMSAEIGLYFVILNNLWDKKDLGYLLKDFPVEVNKSLLTLPAHFGYGIVVVAWWLLNLKYSQDSVEDSLFYIINVIEEKTFPLVLEIISSKIYKKSVVGDIVLESMHKILEKTYEVYSNYKNFFEVNLVIPVFCQLLTNEKVANICVKARNSLDMLIETAINAFPLDFISLTKICNVLLRHESQYQNILQLLIKMPSFLTDLKWDYVSKEWVLNSSQNAIGNYNNIVLHAGTIMKCYHIYNKDLTQYKGTNYLYFSYVEFLITLLLESSRHQIDEELVEKVACGIEVLTNVIKYSKNTDLSLIGVDHLVFKLEKLLLNLDTKFNFRLLTVYFKIYYILIKHKKSQLFKQCSEIAHRFLAPNIQLLYLENDYKSLIFDQAIFDDTIFKKIFQSEEYREDHKLLLLYIKMLKNITKTSCPHRNLQISGLLFIFNCVFLQHQTWVYKNEQQRYKITMECLKLFHRILQKNPTTIYGDELQVFNICLTAFLDNPFIIEAFTRLFIKQKYHLLHLMERETNWYKGQALNILDCIRIQLAVLLLLMNHKKGCKEKVKLDEKLPRIVKPISSYFTNSYSSVIAELSCRFLEKLAQDRNVPMLALLEFDHYQVQTLFLERLRDPLEEENVKIVIIDLINTCITHQDGMTAAFFNLKCFMYWDDDKSEVNVKGNSITEFMIDYLENLKTSHEYLKSPLQLGILKLLSNVWSLHRENLIKSIASSKYFWPVMFDPFFSDFVQFLEVYMTILKIVNLEITTNINKIDDSLLKVLKDFIGNKNQMEKCINYVVKMSEIRNESGKVKSSELVECWKNFIILTNKIIPSSFDDDTKIELTLSCLEGLCHPFTTNNKIEIVHYWLQLYFILISSWPIFYKKQELYIIKKLTKILQLTCRNNYKYLPIEFREILFCVIKRTLDDLKVYLGENPDVLMKFMNEVAYIIDIEYSNIMNEMENIETEDRAKLMKCWLIIIFIGNSLLSIHCTEEMRIWFTFRQFISKVMDSIKVMIKEKSTITFTKIAFSHLISYAESPLVRDFLNVDLFKFYYHIKPPSFTFSVYTDYSKGIPINTKEWWLIFCQLVKLNRLLLEKLNGLHLKECFQFIVEHEVTLIEIMSIIKFTVDMSALTLVCETLNLFYTLLQWKYDWLKFSPRSYDTMVHVLKMTMNSCILSIIGSKKIHLYKITEDELEVVTDGNETLCNIVNKLIEVIFWLSGCLAKYKPSLFYLLDEPYPNEPVDMLIEVDFSVPRFELPITSKITYGKLLCLTHYLCKALSQLTPQSKISYLPKSRVSMLQLPDRIRLKSVNKTMEYCTKMYDDSIGFMVYIQRTEDILNERFKPFLQFDVTDYTGTSSSIVSNLNYEIVKNALEKLMTLMTSEIMVNLNCVLFDDDHTFIYKRELRSEIQFFYEFVKKRTGELYNQSAVASPRTVLQNETELVKRYMLSKCNSINDIADNNFLLVIWHLLSNICNLSN